MIYSLDIFASIPSNVCSGTSISLFVLSQLRLRVTAFFVKTFVIAASAVTDFSIASKVSFSGTTLSFSFSVIVFFTDLISSLITLSAFFVRGHYFLLFSSWSSFSYLTLATLKDENMPLDILIETGVRLFECI